MFSSPETDFCETAIIVGSLNEVRQASLDADARKTLSNILLLAVTF